MTISTVTSTITYLGNGSTTVFSFPFVGVSASDLIVTYTTALGIETVLSGTQYSITLNAVPAGGLWGIGGTVTYPLTGPAMPTGAFLSVTRDVPYTQTISFNNQGAFYAQALEQGLDLLELQIQQLNTGLEYTIRAPSSDPEPPNVLPSYLARANLFLAFDSFGNPIATAGPVSVTPTTSAQPRRIATTGTALIPLLSTDVFAGVSIYQSSTPVTTLQLPAGTSPIPIFDGSLNAGTYPITVLPPAGLSILGQTSFQLTFNGQSITCYNDGIQILLG